MNINNLKKLFLEDFINYGNRLTSKGAYNFQLDKFIKYLYSLKITKPEDITAKVVKEYIRNLYKKKTGEPYAPSSRHLIQSSIKSFLRYLYQNDYTTIDIGSKLERIKTQKKESAYLSKEQYLDFIKIIKKKSTPYYRQRDIALINLLIKSGLRRAEIIRLNISDIDLNESKIWVKRKGGNEEYITMHNSLVEDLSEYLKTLKRDSNQPLFMSKLGRRLSASSVWHLVKSYAFKAGLSQKITTHSLRHSFASNLNASGLSINSIQKLMGHKSPTTTFRYLHISESEIREEFNNKVTFDEGR